MVLNGTEQVPKDTERLDAAKEADLPKIKARQMNRYGYSELMTLCTNDKNKVAFLIVKKSRSADLPNGCLKTAWESLKKRYDTMEIEDVQEVIKAYTDCVLCQIVVKIHSHDISNHAYDVTITRTPIHRKILQPPMNEPPWGS